MMHMVRASRATVTATAATLALMISMTSSAQAVHAQTTVASDVTADGPMLGAAQAHLATPVTLSITALPLRQAIDTLAATAGTTVQYRIRLLSGAQKLVTLHVTKVPLGQALTSALEGTGLKVVALPEGIIGITEATTGSSTAVSGIVTGTITNAKTKQPLRNAAVVLDQNTRGVQTDEQGHFRLPSVAAGTHRITARALGYGKQTQSLTVTDDQTTTVDIALEPSVNALSQVVVTGTVIPTELKAVPSAITVITAKELEQRNITHIDQLFRGEVPGLFAANRGTDTPLGQVAMWSRGATNFHDDGKPIKTYVDGVELADPSYLNQIDPRSIDRIEIIPGPQASTIYGSGAINGVMQIFTKRGTTSRPQLTLTLLSGTLENNFGTALAPQHDFTGQLSGIEGHWSYNAGGTWNYIGHWSPAIQQTISSGFAGGRLQLGSLSVDASFRQALTVNHQTNTSAQVETDYEDRGIYVQDAYYGRIFRPSVATLNGQTMSLTVGYAPLNWWSHELVLGTDAADVGSHTPEAEFASPSDTTMSLSQSTNHRTTMRYSTTVRVPVTSWSQLTTSVGGDAWQSLTTSLSVQSTRLTGTLDGSTYASRQPAHNAGGFLQSQLALGDAFFVTYGLRAEWNPNYGKDAQPNLAPRMGVAYARDIATPFGLVTAKVRGSYGRSTQPPALDDKNSIPSNQFWLDPYFAKFNTQLANPSLGPSSQQGGEGGVELYFGSRASLTVTRYNQTVDNFVITVYGVDSVKSLVPCAQCQYFGATAGHIDSLGYAYAMQSQNMNAISFRNQGWELHGTTTLGPLTTNATYSWTKSRVIGVTERFRAFFPPSDFASYQPGTSFNYLPEHTWAVGLTYGQQATSVTLNISGVAQISGRYTDSKWANEHVSSYLRLRNDAWRATGFLPGSEPMRSGYAMADVNAMHRITNAIEARVQVQNLTNLYKDEGNQLTTTLGRQTKAGLNLRW